MTRMYFIMMSVVAVSILGTQPVQADSNFYLGSELGANFATSLDTIGSDTDRASVCDEFINPGFAVSRRVYRSRARYGRRVDEQV